ncbi:MAG: hypothetical protein LBI45_01780 [Bacteroidales bacterium]|jgi:hypothetical protein|nr:hypothetical protein [Bacteroidales bacterium]
MKINYLFLCGCFAYLFTACTPDVPLLAPYKDVTVVYGMLNQQSDTNFVKIYRGFQSNKPGAVFLDAQNPDSIYYYDDIEVFLLEYKDTARTSRLPIEFAITHNFSRDSGLFYYDKERIIYFTTEKLDKEMVYKIQIKNKKTGNITEGKTELVGEFETTMNIFYFDMLKETAGITYSQAKNGKHYFFSINFIYFEVSKSTNEVVKIGKITRNISPAIGEEITLSSAQEPIKRFSPSFYDDIAGKLKVDPSVTRYIGSPGTNGACIEVEGWAANDTLVKYLLSNKPTSTFIQINKLYTNLTSTDGLAFGVFASRTRLTPRVFSTSEASQDTLCFGHKTRNLGFRPWTEYKP